MGIKLDVPSGTDMKAVKDFCMKYQIPTRKLNASKWYMVLSRMGIPDEGGYINSDRLPVMRAAMKG